MRTLRVLAGAVVIAGALALAGCTPAPVVAPVTVEANDLQGETVKVALNQTLNINTGDLAVDSYTAEITDESVVKFIKGADAGDFRTNPGFTPLKVGSTEVTMTNEDGGIQPIEFTIEVTPAVGGADLGGSGR